jgi:hypothetical protein
LLAQLYRHDLIQSHILDKEGFRAPLEDPIQYLTPLDHMRIRSSALRNPIDCVADVASQQIALMK